MLVRLLVASFIPLLFVVSGVAIFFFGRYWLKESKRQRDIETLLRQEGIVVSGMVTRLYGVFYITVIRHFLEYQYAIDNIDEKKEIEIKDKVFESLREGDTISLLVSPHDHSCVIPDIDEPYREVTRTRRYALGICVFSFIVMGIGIFVEARLLLFWSLAQLR